MIYEPLDIRGLYLLAPRRFADERGTFCETFRAGWFEEIERDLIFIQDNESYSAAAGTVRGLHLQLPPFAQAKLVRVVRGRILDVAVDVRSDSPTFGRWIAVDLDGEEGRQLFIPKGFLHGFVTRTANTVVQYKVSANYDAASERSVRFDDPDLAIEWGIDPADAILSHKDRAAPSFRQFLSADALKTEFFT
jgi:dTDP-4-dehydrorhamnose 3,5-epimerase